MRDEGHGTGSLFLSFIFGGIAGAAAALLLAPQSGRDTRRKVAELADDAKERAGGYVEDARERARSAVQRGREFVDEKRSIIGTAVEAGREAYEREKDKHAKGV